MEKENLELSPIISDGEQPRKLAVLGLPWETTEETLKMYFSQYGALECAEVMKDRYTGKSRGFGFVTFMDAASATRALAVEHTIDGRRCEAKVALPKGEPSPPRTTRIFVARIPPSVTESQFRQYFEGFGKLQDAYMPKDHSKQGYRGIGFVTFASPDSVEKVMAVKHWMNGHEIAIDRATPKEEPTALKNIFARLPMGPGQRRSFDNGSGIIGPGLGSIVSMNNNLISPGAIDATFNNLRSLSEERDISGMMGRNGMSDMMDQLNPTSLTTSASLMNNANGLAASAAAAGMNPALRATSQALGLNLGLGLNGASSTAAAAAAATTAALQTLAKTATLSENVSGVNAHMTALGSSGISPLNGGMPMVGLTSSDLTAATSLLSNGLAAAAASKSPGLGGISGQTMLQELNSLGAAAAVQQMMAAASGRRSLDSTLKRMENPAIANARAGPRIFIGKLTKDTSEADVKEYFMRFGYVMDVYLPKAKDNKAEHRGFGFVTFETDAAIQRVVSHGQHRLKGSTIAIDIAMPKVEDNEMNLDGGLDSPASSLPGFGSLPNMLVQRM
ncbi:hypothetical protein PLESTB_000312400 [Pleodorina starrii]|uniref:RRM domain-containing protein n=1 Tax=Pleodorina starrii TaxID=330485 RepID=A0A9W6BDY0_9CHLO|nr:hypothetical protein PLESTM_001722400 [Pleodorina starrii]GLC49822.1 hypothetical protein PLESTB_000312400 [Pleodorina starrii]GLC76220.1 hypothetical protein PLESTF_001752200 [Pleodorina starrii]